MNFSNDIAQVVGFLAYGLGMMTFYQRDDRRLKVVMFVQNLTYLLHFLLLGAHASVIGAGLSAARTGVSLFYRRWWLAFVFIAIGCVMTAFTAHTLREWLPMGGLTFGCIALFILHGVPMRVAFLCGSMCWLSNNILVGSIGGVMLELTVSTVNLITIWRLSRARRPISAG